MSRGRNKPKNRATQHGGKNPIRRKGGKPDDLADILNEEFNPSPPPEYENPEATPDPRSKK